MEFWIARDSDGELWVYDYKPIKKDGIFQCGFELDECGASELPEWWFNEVTFENSPRQVELKLINQ